MKNRTLTGILGAIGAALVVVVGGVSAVHAAAPAAPAITLAAGGDKIHLKDGRVLEGEILREVEGWIWLKRTVNGVEVTDTIDPKTIASVERSAAAAKPAEEARPAPREGDAAARAPGSAPRAAILTLEGTVGIQMCAKPLKDAIPLLEKDGVDIVVLKINSGGGLLLEIQRLSDVIQNEYKPRFQTVAWIESAISAAAMTAHTVEDIYFKPNGNYGACTGFRGMLDAMKGRSLEEALFMMEKISARGKHPKEIMRAMQISGEDSVLQELQISGPSGKLSADIDETTGEVRWYQDHTGKHILNPKTGEFKILTFNAPEAVKFKFARGIAETPDELARQMGYNEIEWVGKPNNFYGYPVSEAEELQLKWRRMADDAEINFGVYYNDYVRNVQVAQGIGDKLERGPWINKARTALNRLRKLAGDQPNLRILQGLSEDWFERQDEFLRRLAK